MDRNDNFSSHPLSFVRELRAKFGSDVVLGFSRYTYIPRNRRDVRERFSLPIDLVTEQWLHHQLLTLGPEQELALESRAKVGRTIRQVPMLDFRGMTKGQLTAIMEVFPLEYSKGLHVYFSGRSYHAYFVHLLTSREWVKFMGSALLCNTPHDPSVVDQRWVGHRLIGGYSALRWSCNTSHYKSLPQRIDSDELNRTFSEKRSLGHGAKAWIDGVTNKWRHYEELVGMALEDVPANFLQSQPAGQRVVDYLVERPDGKVIAIEAAYSDDAYLPRERVLEFFQRATALAQKDGISQAVLVTNTELRGSEKDLLATAPVSVSIVERTVSPGGLISRLAQYVRSAESTP